MAGSKLCNEHLNAVMKACVNCEGDGDDCFDPEEPGPEARGRAAARAPMCPTNYIQRVIQFARRATKEIEFPTYDTDWDSEAYLTVSGQNSNNSVRVTDAFLKAVEDDGDWDLIGRTTGEVTKTVKARELWDRSATPPGPRADPGMQFHTTINDWHTCPASGEIRASNPCSEYMFLDDTACNLASLNLMQFRGEGRQFDDRALRARVPAVDHGAGNLGADGPVPVAPDRQAVLRYRTLGLGYANIGGLLMASGYSYDSTKAAPSAAPSPRS